MKTGYEKPQIIAEWNTEKPCTMPGCDGILIAKASKVRNVIVETCPVCNTTLPYFPPTRRNRFRDVT
jgi:hypothetical protein